MLYGNSALVNVCSRMKKEDYRSNDIINRMMPKAVSANILLTFGFGAFSNLIMRMLVRL